LPFASVKRSSGDCSGLMGVGSFWKKLRIEAFGFALRLVDVDMEREGVEGCGFDEGVDGGGGAVGSAAIEMVDGYLIALVEGGW
jgi:hypothetical protein